MNEEKWKAVRKFYLDNFNIAPELVDLLADSNILLMCATGASNSSISEILDIDEDSIREVLKAVFDFEGWLEDLPTNPYGVFNAVRGEGSHTFGGYKNWCYPITDKNTIKIMYRVSKRYESILNSLDRNWK